MVKQAKLQQIRHGPTYKFGILVPKNGKDTLALDAANGNKQWQISMDTEVKQTDEYDTFRDLGKGDLRLETIKRLEFTLSMMSNMTCTSKVVSLLKAISLLLQKTASILVL
jgi:hypothetical protein